MNKNVLPIQGHPVHEARIGLAADMNASDAAAWLTKLQQLAAKAQ